MARYAAGDEIAFEPLCALLAPRVRAFFLRSFSDVAVAEALVQTTFLRLKGERASYRQTGRSLKAWLFGIAASVRRDELRRRYGLPGETGEADLERAETGFASDAGPALGTDGCASRTDAARAAIARLPESQRIIVHLYGHEGLTFEEIAEALGTAPEVVRSRARVAYQRLQAELRTYLRSNGAQ
jgi:RNA polymerase sigma-70 factor, ECF subfamily